MPTHALGRLGKFIATRKVPMLLLFAAACTAIFAAVRWSHYAQARPPLRVSMGTGGAHNELLKNVLRQECDRYDVPITIQSVSGSDAALRQIVQGELDVAVVRGFVGRDEPTIHQVCIGVCEVLHLFVRDSGEAHSPIDLLRGKRVYLGPPGSETRALAEIVLGFMALETGVDFQEASFDELALDQRADSDLPEAIFEVSALPSRLGEKLVGEHGYQLVSLPYGPALQLRERTLEEIVIPAYAYGAVQAVPAEPLTTIGCRTVVVASSRVPSATVSNLLEVLFESDFARHAGLPQWDESLVTSSLEYPLHAGATAYLRKDLPLIRSDTVDQFEGMRDALGSTGCAILLLWGWYRRRKVPQLDGYLLKLAEIELEALRNYRLGQLSPQELQGLRERLWLLKREMLEHYTTHREKMSDDIGQALARVRDVDGSLTKLSRAAEDVTPTTYSKRRAA